MRNQRAIVPVVALACSLPSSMALAGKSLLRDSDKANLMPDTKATCIVGGFVRASAGVALIGDFQGAQLRVTGLSKGGGSITTDGVRGGLAGDGFVFVNVPKGPFRVGYLAWAHFAPKPGHTFNVQWDAVGKQAYSAGHAAKMGPGLTELSGTCNGGFIWLGEFFYTPSGTVMPPLIAVKEDLAARKEALAGIKAALGASPWAAEIDKPAVNTPLPDSQEIAAGPPPVYVKPKFQLEVSLLDPGASEGRRALRYAPREGDKRTAVFTTKTGPVTFAFNLDTVASIVDETSPIKNRFTVTRSSLPGQDGVTGFVQYDEQGQNWNNEASFPPGKAPRVGPPMSPVVAVGTALVPLPAEAIAAGARWQAVLTAEGPAFTSVQTFTYTLASVTGNQVKVSIAHEARTTFKSPMPSQGKMMVGNVVKGSGAASFSLDRAIAESYEVASDAETLWGGEGGPHVDPGTPKSRAETKLESK